VFSVEGLINEYVEVARVIRDGKITEVESMTEIEESFVRLVSHRSKRFKRRVELRRFRTLSSARSASWTTRPFAMRATARSFKTMIDLGLCSSEEIVADFAKVTPRKVFGELLQKHLPAGRT
jgi:saccharopine dehydrogenase-like NADP-dependent oxidoreductase